MAAKDDFLIDTLVDMALLTSEQVDEARSEADSTGEGVIDTLVAKGALKSSQVAQAKAANFGVEYVDLSELKLTDDVIAMVPRHIAKKFTAVPVYKVDDMTVAVALADPTDLDTLDGLGHALNLTVEAKVAAPDQIEEALNRFYGGGGGRPGRGSGAFDKMIQDITEGEVEIGKVGELGKDDGAVVDADAPIIKLVNTLIVEAFKQRASDIHLEPLANKFRVRYRIDGVLHEMKGPPKKLQPNILSRLKIQSNMSISEKRTLPCSSRAYSCSTPSSRNSALK